MKTEPSTKTRILEAAEAIMLEQSFHSVGLNQILRAVNVPKGSFYHYFASKEQFGVELLRHYVASASAFKRQMLLSEEPEPDPIQRLLAYLNSMLAQFIEHGGKCPCLALKLATEVSNMSEPMREELAKGYEEWAGIIESVFQEALDKGLVPASLEPAAEAALVQDLWSGAIQRATIQRRADPVRQAAELIRTRLTFLE